MIMFSARSVTLALLMACILGSLSTGEGIPPGKYDCSGRVVKRADGELAVFLGSGCRPFPKKLRIQLRPYVGKFVKVEYTRMGEEEAGIYSSVGSVIGRIDNVSVLAESADQLPVVVTAKPTKAVFELAEPVEVRVSITNRSTKQQSMQLGVSHTVLCQDYQGRLVLEPEGHYYDKSPYGLPKGSVLRTLAPGQKLEFTVTSQQMADPGTYQLVYSLSLGPRKLGSQSEIEQVTVGKAGNETEEQEALKKWLSIATVGQRIKIAGQLLRFGDTSGTEEVLRLLEANEYSKRHYCNGAAFRFAWQHGGKKGEVVMLGLIERQTKQDRVLRMIEGIHLSSNRIQLLQELLSCAQPTGRDMSGWIDGPRICDVTAAWLMGYTNGRMEFPGEGSRRERDEAVASVKKVLKQNPSFFHVLSKSYR